MLEYILKENVLTDDVLYMAEDGKVFKGGYIAIVKYNTFQSAWSDKEHVKRFRNEKSLNEFLSKNYKDFEFYY